MINSSGLNAFVKFGPEQGSNELEGSCTVEGKEKWIQATSFSHDVNQLITPDTLTARNGHRGCQGAHVGDFNLSKHLDQASPKLAEACCLGTKKRFDEVIVQVCNDEYVMMKYTLTDVIVSDVSVSGGGSQVMENVSLNFTKICWEYADPDGGVVPGEWDVSRQKAQA